MTLTVPINQQSKLRAISSINQINKCVSILKTKPKIKRTMWSRRAQEYDQKINSGKIYELAEVERGSQELFLSSVCFVSPKKLI